MQWSHCVRITCFNFQVMVVATMINPFNSLVLLRFKWHFRAIPGAVSGHSAVPWQHVINLLSDFKDQVRARQQASYRKEQWWSNVDQMMIIFFHNAINICVYINIYYTCINHIKIYILFFSILYLDCIELICYINN